MKYNTRFAPSPTGCPHLGNIRTAYFNWLAAKSSGGKFILRIDDTDLARNNQTYVNDIIDIMNWLKLDYDDIVYQSDRTDRYLAIAQALCDDDDNAVLLDNGAIALVTDQIPRMWTDTIAGDIIVTESDVDHCSGLILIKSDGMPTYHFASVIDDMDFDINYVIRGHDHISNVPKQISLINNIGATIPMYSHVGLIHHKKKKLSKRNGAVSALWYRDRGYDPDALLNFLLRLGWGPKGEGKQHKVIDRQFALDIFLKGGNLRNQSANMDINMLDSYDRKYKARKRNK